MSGVSTFEAMRARATAWTALGCWPLALCAILTAWAVGGPLPPVAVAAIGCAVLATLGATLGGPDGRLMTALGFVGQATAITAALAGHPWQVDSHMIFFALLAITMGMADVRAVILTSAGIALHHLGLTLVMPALVYPSFDAVPNLLRTGFHGLVVVIMTVSLTLAIRSRARLDAAVAETGARLADRTRQDRDAAIEEARAARAAAEAAMHRAQADRAAAEAAQARAETAADRARRADEATRAAEEAHYATLAADAAQQAQVVAILSEGLERLARKDLGCDILAPMPAMHDELRRNFNAALAALRAAIDQVAADAREMAEDGAALRDAAHDLSLRTDAHTATIEGTAATIGDIVGRVRIVAERASKADGMVQDVHEAARTAEQVVRQAAGSMADLRDTADRIEAIVGTIEDISFRTNLLSLNAGIEAARAGPAGRGFGVVAVEVGMLARKSSEAASAISALADSSRLRVDAGIEQVEGSVGALDRIMTLVQSMRANVSDIAEATGAQSAQLGEIDGALDDLGRIARSNAAAAHASFAGASGIGDRATRLDRAMAGFSRPPGPERAIARTGLVA